MWYDDDTISTEEYKRKFSKHVCDEIYKLLAHQKAKKKDGAFINALIVNVLATFIGRAVYETLCERSPSKNISKEDAERFVFKNFSTCKVKIQDAVAAGFTAAMTSYAKEPVEYYCQIKVVQHPVNKEPC